MYDNLRMCFLRPMGSKSYKLFEVCHQIKSYKYLKRYSRHTGIYHSFNQFYLCEPAQIGVNVILMCVKTMEAQPNGFEN